MPIQDFNLIEVNRVQFGNLSQVIAGGNLPARTERTDLVCSRRSKSCFQGWLHALRNLRFRLIFRWRVDVDGLSLMKIELLLWQGTLRGRVFTYSMVGIYTQRLGQKPYCVFTLLGVKKPLSLSHLSSFS